MRVSFNDVGKLGIIKDTPDHDLPFDAWSDGRNVRFFDNKVLKFPGHLPPFGTPSVPPYWLLSVPTAALYFWLYAGLEKVFAFNAGVHTDITRLSGDYTGGADNPWNGGLIGGVPVFTNGVDLPQVWNPASFSTKLIDLPNWPTTYRAKIIRPFREFLVALDITKGITRFPHMVKWSHPADPGTIPISWDETDPTKDAGEKDLTDTDAGFVLDCLPLRNVNIVYKEGSTWIMQHIGGTFVFRIDRIFEQLGLLAPRCVVTIGEGERHFLATADDLVIHDGQTPISLLDRRQRRTLVNTIDSVNFRRSFAVRNPTEKEYWFCYPEAGNSFPNRAIVWNQRDNTLGHRDIPLAAFGWTGVVEDLTGLTWDSDSGTWDSDSSVWGERLYGFKGAPVLAVPSPANIFQTDQTEQFNGQNFLSYIERLGMPLGHDREGNRVPEHDKFKLVSRIWPKVKGGPVNIRLGSQKLPGGAVTWTAAKSFNPATQIKLDFLDKPENGGFVPGRYVTIRVESEANIHWELEAFDLDIKILSDF